MKEGFYYYRNNIYYGCYNETQVSGKITLARIKPEYIQSDRPIHEDDQAVQLWNNHSLLDPEYADLKAMLSKMKTFVNLNTEQEN